MTYRTGQIVELSRPERPYSHMGFVDRKTILPADTETIRITRVTRGGDRLTLRRDDNTGFGIVVSEWLRLGFTIKVVG